jgi:hypothetical protein
MPDNFRGVPIFIIFVVDWQSRNFPPTKINVYSSMDEGRGQKRRGSAATYMYSLC